MKINIEELQSNRKIQTIPEKFSKVVGYKINRQKSIAFLCNTSEPSKKEIKKIIPLTIASKKIKQLRINLTKEMKDLYTENYKTLLKK